VRHILIIILSFLLLSSPLQISNITFAQEKQKACLAPMGSLGDFSEMEKQIIFNSLQESLSTHYVLASQKAFEAAQTQAFEEWVTIEPSSPP
jgi:hypothetical protein